MPVAASWAAGHGVQPLPQLSAVEMPGRVANPDEAVLSVGGLEAVGRTILSKEGRLRLRLCRGYQFQAPVPMRRRRTSDLLVRAKRRADGSWECTFVGVVTLTFTAEALADFIFAPGPELNFGETPVAGSIEQELSGRRPAGPPYMPPAFFTRVDTPQPYDFDENSFLRRQRVRQVGKVAGTAEAKLRRVWVAVSMVRFHQPPPVPDVPPEGAFAQLREGDDAVVEEMRRLFQERPLWTRGPLEERLAALGLRPNVTTMQKSLQCVSYLWTDGPWRGAYGRLGWDPRTNPEEAKRLQVIDFRDRFFRQQRIYFEALKGGLTDMPVLSLDCHFRTAPVNRSQLYQLADIEDGPIQETLETTPVLAECSEKSGWLPQAAIQAIRARMAVKAELMRRAQAFMPKLETPAAGTSADTVTMPALENEAAASGPQDPAGEAVPLPRRPCLRKGDGTEHSEEATALASSSGFRRLRHAGDGQRTIEAARAAATEGLQVGASGEARPAWPEVHRSAEATQAVAVPWPRAKRIKRLRAVVSDPDEG